jgi:hypothetical protein
MQKMPAKIKMVLKDYPTQARKKITELRELIFEAAAETNDVGPIEETLKWGEPSYIAKYGSTIRVDWKEKAPDAVSIYFKCTSLLVPIFKKIFKDDFKYEKNRAIYFKLDEKLPKRKLKKCITAALLYHKVKNEPNLGIIS